MSQSVFSVVIDDFISGYGVPWSNALPLKTPLDTDTTVKANQKNQKIFDLYHFKY